jgi:transcriptional regulator with XRE-family HTH domain
MTDTRGREQLIEAMEQRGISQAVLATQLGITQNSVSLWKRGLTRPEAHHREALRNLLGIDPTLWRTPEEQALIDRTARPAA